MSCTLYQLESMIDQQQTIRQMKRELEQLYYFVEEHPQGVEESPLAYMRYTKSVVHAGKKQKFTTSDEKLLYAIVEKDRQLLLQRKLEEELKEIAQTILKGIASLPQKEKILLEDVYLRKRDKDMMCYQLGISQSTLRRKLQNATYHLALILHKVILKE